MSSRPARTTEWGPVSIKPGPLRVHRDQEEGYLHSSGQSLNCHTLKNATHSATQVTSMLAGTAWVWAGAEEVPAELFLISCILLYGQEKADSPTWGSQQSSQGKGQCKWNTCPDGHSGIKAGPSP